MRCPFSHECVLFCFCCYRVAGAPRVFWIQVSYQMRDLQVLPPALGVVFLLPWWCALKPEALHFDEGDYDQSKTKVLHLSQNPAGAARQRLREEQQQLQEECARLRELVRALEAGGPIPAHLEAAAGLPSSREVAELKKQVESAELKNQRLKEVFQTKIQEFRKVCYTLTGYQVDITTESQYRLTSMYAEQKADCLIFKAAGPSGTKMQLLETAFSRTVPGLIELHLLRQDSIPAFLSALTLDLFSRQTVA
ncbi:mitotic spindle assembly checkpoint protein MAD1 isoform X3 [Bos mutus]|uniref:mitotic spindle assembly checkpoint protein MAD1 isoform X3 n=1 Tax=Bos mutus TaxID=72004 RepID=UPI0038B44394